MGTVLEFDQSGRLRSHAGKVARQRGTTVTVTGLFKPLPVRRKELERTAKREFGKALSLLTAYALVPCANENRGVRLSVTNHPAGGKKTVQLRTDGTPLTRSSASAIWGPKALENVVVLDLCFDVETERSVLRRQGIKDTDGHRNEVRVKGLVSKFAVACGRTGTDRQFFYVNGRPCNPSKVQKAFNEVYRTFNANQTPFIVADFILPTDSCDVNVSPDKRTILLHSENNLVNALKIALEQAFAPSRSTYVVNSQSQAPLNHPAPTQKCATASSGSNVDPLFLPDHAGEHECSEIVSQKAGELEARVITEEPEDMDENATLSTPLLAGTKAITGVEHVQMHKKYIPASYAIEPHIRPVSSCSGSEPASPSQGTRRSPHIHFPVTALLSTPSISQEKRENASLALGGDDIDMDDDGLDDAADRSLMSTQMIDAVNDSPQESATQRCVIEESPHTNPCAADEAAGIELSTAADDVRSSRDSNSPDSRATPQVSTKKRVAFHSADTSRKVQMVLDTSGAAWNLRRHADGICRDRGR
ncbi:Mismatch repair endonuclease PMS2 [Grifola frondosa]|uniref:Mismatch repair endonuclease PMS2 n=1 Tax=Grifola frondosa TaxID=5627 RepID=A0A1C7MI20_GRIFR|nr:Mismatch repair endonuclease PMS2 [Grifola frondosa]